MSLSAASSRSTLVSELSAPTRRREAMLPWYSSKRSAVLGSLHIPWYAAAGGEDARSIVAVFAECHQMGPSTPPGKLSLRVLVLPKLAEQRPIHPECVECIIKRVVLPTLER